jgi:hypothetical protein
VDFACPINFTIREGVRGAAAAHGIAINRKEPQAPWAAAALSFHPTRRSYLSDGRLPKATLSPGMETINLELKGPTNSDEATKRASGSLLAGFL